ncbi:alpha/beta fold hydrolase [Rubrivirga sp.]|uniref:alpha/beta fold hydrolase n=1 Tax=Rubrivirga sp. TaxID=1885344 RepID=UPI003C720D52
MTLDHIGIAIRPEHAALYKRLLSSTPYKAETVEREGVRTLFFGDGGLEGVAPKLELLEATRDASPVATFLDKRGPGVHHLAFEVPDLEAEMERVRDLGIRLLADAPKPGADGKQIVFLHPKDTAGVLIELVQSVRKAPEWVEISTPGGLLAVQVSGPADAPPLLVLHGALGSTELETDRLIRVWEKTFRVYGLDFSGHGRSADLEIETPGWQTYVDDAITACDELGLEAASVFGFSMGAAVGLGLACQRPDLVGRLASHGANVQWTDLEVEAMVGPMLALEDETSFWARRLEDVHGSGWRRLVESTVAFTRALPNAHLSDDELSQIECPVLISHGDSDRFFNVEHALTLRRSIPDSRLWVIPGLDHPIQGVEVEAFASAVGAFLAG